MFTQSRKFLPKQGRLSLGNSSSWGRQLQRNAIYYNDCNY